MDIICGKTHAYIPTSANELISSIEILNNSMRDSIPPKLRMGFKIHRVETKIKINSEVPRHFVLPTLHIFASLHTKGAKVTS